MRAAPIAILFATIGAISCSSVSSGSASSMFRLESQEDRVVVLLDGRPLTNFHFHSKWDKPFLYPIRTVSGNTLSRGWPVEPREGDEQDHAWHRGIFYGHGDVNGEDFWREKPDKSTARLVLDGEPRISNGAKGSLDVSLSMIGAKGNRMGTIGERYVFRREGSQILIDSTISVSADGGTALKFGDTDDGGFGFRLATEFRQDRGAELLNSDGLAGTQNIWGKPARWVKYKTKVNGKEAAVAVLDHPSNLRHPTGWHARGYSLCSANPFATAAFTKDKTKDGSYTLASGAVLKLRYLVVISDGDVATPAMEKLFSAYAKE